MGLVHARVGALGVCGQLLEAEVPATVPEAGLGGGMAIIIAAKGIGKAGADGSISWNIESTPDGKVLVNGIDPTTLGK